MTDTTLMFSSTVTFASNVRLPLSTPLYPKKTASLSAPFG
jgi:hypothetical protein